VQVPAGAEVVDRVAPGRADGLLCEVGAEPELGDGVEQAGLVAEEAVDAEVS
jgi:hypothetical protein